MANKMNLVFLGPPGAGKGTQAKMMVDRYSIPQISTGDILRKAVAAGTELGKEAKKFMDAGGLVPDDVVIGLAKERLKEADCKKGYILDGFPRTVVQAKTLDSILSEMGESISHVISIVVHEGDLLKRLTGRRTCRQCNSMYHVHFEPSKKGDACDKCDGELYQRNDDKEETIKSRLKVYKDQTEPLIAYYRGKGLLRDIPGSGDIKQIFERITKVLDS